MQRDGSASIEMINEMMIVTDDGNDTECPIMLQDGDDPSTDPMTTDSALRGGTRAARTRTPGARWGAPRR
jgi:hypothetical protein